MNEELLQRDLLKNPEKIGKWDFYNIGATTIKALKEAGIILNVDYGDIDNKKVDAIIVSRKKVIAIIEYKKPAEFKTKAQQEKAINQEIEVAKILKAKIIIATDTQETVWVNVQTGNRIKDENGQELKYKFDKADEKLPALIEKINFSIHEKNDQIKPKELVNPTDLARSIWQDIWSVSGATPENCLYTFVELFIFKYLSDLGVLQGIYNFDTLMSSYSSNNTEEVLDIYANTIRPKVKVLFPESTKDKTTIINGTIFVSKDQKAVKGYSTVFKKVLEKFKTYGKLEHIDYDFKSQLFESFLKESISKKNWGQFFTPLCVVRAITEMAKDDIKEGITICDPACGVGKFLLEPIKKHLENFYKVDKKGIAPKIKLVGYDKGFDKDEQKTIILAKANMLIYFSDLIRDNPNLTHKFSELFNESFELKTNSILGTLSEPVRDEYDLILTNPPYVMSGSSNLKEEISKDGELKDYYKVNAMGVEGLFMEWIIRALKPNGKAYIIVPDGLFNRQSDKNMRQFILDECYIDGIISLPLKTFFTTPQKTYILCLTKKANKKDIQNFPVFTYLVSEIGETRDIYRFSMLQDDLSEAVELFSFYKGNKQGFAKFNPDKRCKVQPISIFADRVELPNAWYIDNFWNKEDKIVLGILDEEVSIKAKEYPYLLENTANIILTLKNELVAMNQEISTSTLIKSFTLIELFDIISGNSKLTQAYLNRNKGEFVVYSANTKENGVFGYINTFDHETECIQITTNGVYAGTVFYRAEHKFSINGDARLLIKKNENLHYQYLVYQLSNVFNQYNFNWQNKPTVAKIKDILIEIPIKINGDFDIETQQQIAEKYQKIEEIKKQLEIEVKKITTIKVEI
ncbi:MAG: restriction endonuclease subunit M/S [Bacteroidetes bacterium]|nr:MAG: restriction endonuclease subunit M/S [Bacteroidota bacterium]